MTTTSDTPAARTGEPGQEGVETDPQVVGSSDGKAST